MTTNSVSFPHRGGQGELFAEPAATLKGTVAAVIFSAPSGTFAVLRLRPDGEGGQVSVTVPSEPPLVGQEIELTGEWVQHPRFGLQFKAASFHLVAPTSAAGIERFLASGVIEGVGKVTAKRLVRAFGERTLDVIENEPHRLSEVKGLGKKTAEKIVKSYRSQSELREIMLWLEGHGLSGTFAARIFKAYGSGSLHVLESKPYRLAREIEGIGFLTADALATTLGVERESTARIAAGLDYALGECAQNGNVCLPEDELAGKAARLLGLGVGLVADVLSMELRRGALRYEYFRGENLVYPPYLYQAERGVAERLLALKKRAVSFVSGDASALVEKWERRSGLALAQAQREAVAASLTEGVLVLTGGPGTGKTTVVRGMIELMEERGLEVLLGAPTGRAAKRLQEASGHRAMTVHRMLEAAGGEGGVAFGRDEDEPLEADVIILDETSMMDTLLMYYFLLAVPKGCHLVLVGDVDQLPAVGPGAVLKDILRSGAVPSVRLTEVFRQGEGSGIVLAAHAINAGRMPALGRLGESDFAFIELPDEEVPRAILALAGRSLPQMGFSPLADVQVLSPMHRYDAGTENLNTLLQQELNPPAPEKRELKSGVRVLREGDKVMQTKNNYQKGVFNGDTGFIKSIGEEGITVRFEGELEVEYQKSELIELTLAYAISVHKSQGSEYSVIILPLVRAHYIMLQRNLLYTAVTRAKARVVLLGSRAALTTAVETDRTRRRLTLLAERLGEKLD